jgi:hypothetical protein
MSAARLQYPLESLYLVKLNQMKTVSVKKYCWSGKYRMNPSVMGEITQWTRWRKKNPSFHLQKPSPSQAIITTNAAPHGWGATLTFTKHSNFLNHLPPTRINNTSFQYQSQPAAEPVTVDEDYVYSNDQQTRISRNTHGPSGISSSPQREGLLYCLSLF